VLDAGCVVDQGVHADLLAAGGLYARIYRAQQQAEGIVVPPSPARMPIDAPSARTPDLAS
jgi:hypothetical protein